MYRCMDMEGDSVLYMYMCILYVLSVEVYSIYVQVYGLGWRQLLSIYKIEYNMYYLCTGVWT